MLRNYLHLSFLIFFLCQQLHRWYKCHPGRTNSSILTMNQSSANKLCCRHFFMAMHVQKRAKKKKEKKPVPLTSTLDGAVKIINVIQSQSWVRLFNSVCDKAVLLYTTGEGCSVVQLLSSELATVSKWNTIFAWKKLWLFRLGYLADIFSKKNEVSCHFKENNWQYLLLRIKFEILGMSLTPSQYLKAFLMRLVVLLIKANFWHFKMKYVKIWKICKTEGMFFKWPRKNVTISQMGRR